MANRDGRLLKWTGHELLKFLSIYRKYEELWDTNNDNFNKKYVRQISLRKLLVELTEIGFDIPSETHLRKKIKNIKDVYRNELNKVKKSLAGGSEYVYKPKLLWYNEADAFLNNIMSVRQSCPNLEDVVVVKTAIKDEEANSDDVKNAECPVDKIPQPVTETHINAHQMTESASSTLNNEQVIGKSRSPQPPKKKVKKGQSNPLESLNQSVAKLHEIALMTSSDVIEDEYYYFAMHIASQLRKLPMRSFIILQERIQSLITEERLNTLVSPDQSACRTPSSFTHTSSPTSNFFSSRPSPSASSESERVEERPMYNLPKYSKNERSPVQ